MTSTHTPRINPGGQPLTVGYAHTLFSNDLIPFAPSDVLECFGELLTEALSMVIRVEGTLNENRAIFSQSSAKGTCPRGV